MGETTAISWCDHTFNLWWGCWKIADECKHCYAEALARRFRKLHGDLWERTGPRRFFGDAHWDEPRAWNRRAERDGVRRRVFVGSMMDWAERHPVPDIARQMDAFRGRMWQLINECQALDWLLLSKRIEDVAEALPWVADGNQVGEPWPNVWIGTTAGTVQSLRKNAPTLRNVPARVRFISGEPLLEHISAEEWDAALGPVLDYFGEDLDAPPVHWLIVGDESGRDRRPVALDAVRTARDAAERHGVSFHYKQWHDSDRKTHLPILDGVQHAAFPEIRP